MRVAFRRVVMAVAFVVLPFVTLGAVDKKFHDAPDSTKALKNPYDGQADAVDAGKTVDQDRV